jgi:DNA-binding MarR family transcriptional regulator
MKKVEGRSIWPKFSRAKDIQIELSERYNVKLLDFDTAVIFFIAGHFKVTINKIHKTKYFRKYGLSTVKRSVHKLIDAGMLTVSADPLDKRKKILDLGWED